MLCTNVQDVGVYLTFWPTVGFALFLAMGEIYREESGIGPLEESGVAFHGTVIVVRQCTTTLVIGALIISALEMLVVFRTMEYACRRMYFLEADVFAASVLVLLHALLDSFNEYLREQIALDPGTAATLSGAWRMGLALASFCVITCIISYQVFRIAAIAHLLPRVRLAVT